VKIAKKRLQRAVMEFKRRFADYALRRICKRCELYFSFRGNVNSGVRVIRRQSIDETAFALVADGEDAHSKRAG